MKKALIIVLSLCMIFSVTACGGTSGTTPAAPAQPAASSTQAAEAAKPAESAVEAEPTLITFWDWYDAEEPRFFDAIDDYKALNPHITVERTTITRNDFDSKVVRAAAANQLPDIFINSISRFQAWADAGIGADITDLVDQYGAKENYFASSLEPLTWQGKLHGLPMYNNVWMLYYNMDMFEQKGVTEVPATWEEFRAACEKTVDKANGIYGAALTGNKSEEGSVNFLYWLWQADADLYDLRSDNSKSAFSMIQNLVKDGLVSGDMLNWNQADSFQQFLSGRAAMTLNGSWQLGPLNDATFNWGMAELPVGKKQHGIMGGEGIGISTDCTHPEEALKFILFMHEPDNYLKYKLNSGGNLAPIPAVNEKDVIKSNTKISECAATLAYCKTRAYGPNYPEISSILQEAVQSNILGNNIDEIVDTAAAKIEPLLPPR